MKKLLFLIIAGCLSTASMAQDLPQPSPKGKLEQVVGLTSISIEYSRPGVKGRTIFGDLVPYDKVWRLGANECTKFTCNTDIDFGGQVLKAGTYAMFAMPGKGETWKIMFNTDTKQWGAYNYDESKNVVIVEARAQESNFDETLTMNISGINNYGGNIVIEWEKLSINIPFSVKTDDLVKKNIEAAVEKGEDLDIVYYKAASYAFKSLKNETMAMDYLKKSFEVKKAHNSMFLKAQILKAQGKKDEAIKTAEMALEMAKAADKKGWADHITENIEAWKK